MTNKKKSAPKTEAKVKATPKPKAEEVKAEAPSLNDGSYDEATDTLGETQSDTEEVAVKDPSSDLRFHVGDIAQHNGSNYLCIATNGQQCAVFVPSHIQTTYSRVVEQRCLLMNNEPL